MRLHHADLAASARTRATILVMFETARALPGIAARQRQLRRVARQEALAREAMRGAAGNEAGNDGNCVIRIRLGRRLG